MLVDVLSYPVTDVAISFAIRLTLVKPLPDDHGDTPCHTGLVHFVHEGDEYLLVVHGLRFCSLRDGESHE